MSWGMGMPQKVPRRRVKVGRLEALKLRPEKSGGSFAVEMGTSVQVPLSHQLPPKVVDQVLQQQSQRDACEDDKYLPIESPKDVRNAIARHHQHQLHQSLPSTSDCLSIAASNRHASVICSIVSLDQTINRLAVHDRNTTNINQQQRRHQKKPVSKNLTISTPLIQSHPATRDTPKRASSRPFAHPKPSQLKPVQHPKLIGSPLPALAP
ncbi:hypothetical protein J3F83DRAFT_304022 [Trichoderma novae-zelandiae]